MSAVREMVEEMVDEMLDEGGPITISGSVFYRSAIMREMDPTAYREILLGYADALISDLQDDLDRLDPEVDADELDDIKDRIEQLEAI